MRIFINAVDRAQIQFGNGKIFAVIQVPVLGILFKKFDRQD